MFTKKNLVIISLIFALIYHFIFHFRLYGPSLGKTIYYANSLLGVASVFIIILVFFGTNWRYDIKGNLIFKIFDLLVLWIFFSFFRSIINIHGMSGWMDFLFNPFLGLSLFPVLFVLVGVNSKYFSTFNKILTAYCIIAWFFSLFFMNYSELQVFLLMPVPYLILTFPFQSPRNRILTLIISVTVIITSWTNRAGAMRILISYLIIIIYYIIIRIKINRKIINLILLCILMSPFYFFYMGIKGENVIEKVLGNNTEGYGQQNLRADTRTFLYFEVLQDLKMNKSLIFGKGIDAGYISDSFQDLSRNVVEVGFLQILLKTGILGYFLYITLIISAIYKALNKSKNLFMKFLGVFLASYVMLFFIENVLAFNLLNIVIWIVVGMCHSEALRNINDNEIKALFINLQG